MFTREELEDPGFWDGRLEQINIKLKRAPYIREDVELMDAVEWKTKFYEGNEDIKKSLSDIMDNLNKKGMGSYVSKESYIDELFFASRIIDAEVPLLTKNKKEEKKTNFFKEMNKQYVLCIKDSDGKGVTFKNRDGTKIELKNGTALGFATAMLLIPKKQGIEELKLMKYGWETQEKSIEIKKGDGTQKRRVKKKIEANFTIKKEITIQNQLQPDEKEYFKPLVYLNYLASNASISVLGPLIFMCIANIFKGIPIYLELDPFQDNIEKLRSVYKGYGLKNVRNLDKESKLQKLFENMIQYRVSKKFDTDAFSDEMPNIWMVYENHYDTKYYDMGLFIAAVKAKETEDTAAGVSGS